MESILITPQNKKGKMIHVSHKNKAVTWET
jgi:hypothetical protein